MAIQEWTGSGVVGPIDVMSRTRLLAGVPAPGAWAGWAGPCLGLLVGLGLKLVSAKSARGLLAGLGLRLVSDTADGWGGAGLGSWLACQTGHPSRWVAGWAGPEASLRHGQTGLARQLQLPCLDRHPCHCFECLDRHEACLKSCLDRTDISALDAWGRNILCLDRHLEALCVLCCVWTGIFPCLDRQA